jgi:hypothetical protein
MLTAERAFRLEIEKLAQKPVQPPSPAVDALCTIFEMPKPRTPRQKAQELADDSLRRQTGFNPGSKITERHAHLVHSDPGMTTPGV